MSIPFSKRASVAVAVFACLAVAQQAQSFTSSPTVAGSLNTVYAALYNDYQILITVPPFQVSTTGTNQIVPLDTTIAQALTDVTTLNALVQAIPPGQLSKFASYQAMNQAVSPAAQITLAQLQIVVGNALTQVANAAAAKDDGQ